MAGKSLKYQIILGGKVSNTFGQLGQALDYLGQEIDTVSQKAINFGKESVESYVEYDDIMRQVQALGEYDTNTMKNLDTYNRSIAQSSKYTMAEIAEAEVMMAQIGLNMKDTQTLMPVVMNFAAAADIDLADSLDYLYYTLNALGLPMENASVLSDQMAKASAISAANIDTLGQSLQRLGSASQLFTGGSAEILAILSGISNISGDMQGLEAGTYLRNFMLTLLAPTGSKATIMESLDITEDAWSEFESYMDEAGITVSNASAAMDKLGLSVYDATTGEIKPALQIIGELKAALDGLTPEERNQTLSDLFGKRTYVLASNLLSVYDDILADYNEISGGSEGYTEYMAAIVEGGLGGAMRELEAAYSELKVNIGEIISEPVQNVAEWLHGIVTDISNMDDAKLNAIVGAVEVVAGAGSALLVMSVGMKALSFILTPGGAVVTGIVAVTAFLNAMSEWNEAKFEDEFGNLTLNTEKLGEYIEGLGSKYDTAYKKVNKFNDELDESVSAYTTATKTFSGGLLEALLTGEDVSEGSEAYNQAFSLGESITKALMAGINSNYAANMTSVTNTLGGEGIAEDDPMWSQIITVMGIGYDNAIKKANSLSASLRSAMTSAFADESLTGEEVQNIMSIINEMNELMAIQTNAENYAGQQALLRKAQTLGLDGMDEIIALWQAERDQTMEDLYANQDSAYGNYKATLEYMVENGLFLDGEVMTEARAAEMLAAYKARQEQEAAGYEADFTPFLNELLEQTILGSDSAEVYESAREYANAVKNGEITAEDAFWEYGDKYDLGERNSASNFVEDWLELFGGVDGAKALLDGYIRIGDTENADAIQNLLGTFWLLSKAGTAHATGDDYHDAADDAGTIFKELVGENGELEAEINVTDNGTGAALKTALDETFDDTITQEVVVTQTTEPEGFANGGRATTASIFGEAGAEWAIPEQHTERTASLLNAARAASGFTWPELIARNGGLNGNAGGSTQQLIYSPTIIANDASGVEAKLREDKERLERWLEERSLRRAVEAYA